MSVRAPIAFTILVALLALIVLASARRLQAAQDRLDRATASLVRVQDDVGRIELLRQTRQRIAERRRPEQDVIARVNAVLHDAGVPLERFAGVEGESDRPLPSGNGSGPAYHRQSMRLTLETMTIAEVGRFLSEWTASQHLWTPSRIQLSHDTGRGAQADAYTVTIVISTTYLAD